MSLLSTESLSPGSSIRRVPKESSSIVVFITSPASLFKGALVAIRVERCDALVSEEASWLVVLKTRESGLTLALLPSRLTLFERRGTSSELPLPGLSLSLSFTMSLPPGSPVGGVPKESLFMVVFIILPVGLSKRAMVTEIVEKRDAWVSEETSWFRMLKSPEPGLLLALLPSRLTMFKRGGSSSVLPLPGLSLSL